MSFEENGEWWERTMPDDLTTRCLAEVERAMNEEPHDDDCRLVTWKDQVRARSRWCVCNCTRDQRLASRLARMMAAGANAATKGMARRADRPVESGAQVLQEAQNLEDEIVRAVAAAREVDQ